MVDAWAPDIAIVSTGFRVAREFRERHFASVRAQTVRPTWHAYNDAAIDKPTACAEQLFAWIHRMPPATIVCWVDGDDWLAHPFALETVVHAHEQGAWVTWGSYERWHQSGNLTPGKTAYAVPHPERCRRLSWFASHLKTFRAGLFHLIHERDLHTPVQSPYQPNTDWITDCVDLAVMWPLLEMAGTEHAHFIPEVLYTYNASNPESVHNSKNGRLEYQRAEGDRLRTLPRYHRLEKAPWHSPTTMKPFRVGSTSTISTDAPSKRAPVTWGHPRSSKSDRS